MFHSYRKSIIITYSLTKFHHLSQFCVRNVSVLLIDRPRLVLLLSWSVNYRFLNNLKSIEQNTMKFHLHHLYNILNQPKKIQNLNDILVNFTDQNRKNHSGL